MVQKQFRMHGYNKTRKRKNILLKKLSTLLKFGKYEEAAKICSRHSLKEIKDSLLTEAYETSDFSFYSFSLYMFTETRKNEWIEISLSLVIGPLCFVDGAYSIGLFHARQLLANEYSIQNLEMLLFFYNLPEKLLENKEAIDIAKQLLVIDSNNKIAKKILLDINEND